MSIQFKWSQSGSKWLSKMLWLGLIEIREYLPDAEVRKSNK